MKSVLVGGPSDGVLLWLLPMDLLPVLLPVLLGLAPAKQTLPADLTPLRESLQRTTSLSARFEQTKHLKALQDELVTTGQLHYRRGGRLVWHTNPPSESDLVLEGTTATLKVAGMSSAQAFDLSSEPGMGKVFETLRAVLEADFERLTPLFELQILRARPLGVSLKPRTEALARVPRPSGSTSTTVPAAHVSREPGSWTGSPSRHVETADAEMGHPPAASVWLTFALPSPGSPGSSRRRRRGCEQDDGRAGHQGHAPDGPGLREAARLLEEFGVLNVLLLDLNRGASAAELQAGNGWQPG